jgi:hypothetical protein
MYSALVRGSKSALAGAAFAALCVADKTNILGGYYGSRFHEATT